MGGSAVQVSRPNIRVVANGAARCATSVSERKYQRDLKASKAWRPSFHEAYALAHGQRQPSRRQAGT